MSRDSQIALALSDKLFNGENSYFRCEGRFSTLNKIRDGHLYLSSSSSHSELDSITAFCVDFNRNALKIAADDKGSLKSVEDFKSWRSLNKIPENNIAKIPPSGVSLSKSDEQAAIITYVAKILDITFDEALARAQVYYQELNSLGVQIAHACACVDQTGKKISVAKDDKATNAILSINSIYSTSQLKLTYPSDNKKEIPFDATVKAAVTFVPKAGYALLRDPDENRIEISGKDKAVVETLLSTNNVTLTVKPGKKITVHPAKICVLEGADFKSFSNPIFRPNQSHAVFKREEKDSQLNIAPTKNTSIETLLQDFKKEIFCIADQKGASYKYKDFSSWLETQKPAPVSESKAFEAFLREKLDKTAAQIERLIQKWNPGLVKLADAVIEKCKINDAKGVAHQLQSAQTTATMTFSGDIISVKVTTTKINIAENKSAKSLPGMGALHFQADLGTTLNPKFDRGFEIRSLTVEGQGLATIIKNERVVMDKARHFTPQSPIPVTQSFTPGKQTDTSIKINDHKTFKQMMTGIFDKKKPLLNQTFAKQLHKVATHTGKQLPDLKTHLMTVKKQFEQPQIDQKTLDTTLSTIESIPTTDAVTQQEIQHLVMLIKMEAANLALGKLEKFVSPKDLKPKNNIYACSLSKLICQFRYPWKAAALPTNSLISKFFKF